MTEPMRPQAVLDDLSKQAVARWGAESRQGTPESRLRERLKGRGGPMAFWVGRNTTSGFIEMCEWGALNGWLAKEPPDEYGGVIYRITEHGRAMGK